MSVLRLNFEDNFSIVTTAIHRAPWGSRRAQIQLKTHNNEIELTTSNINHLDLIVDALEQLMEDINDESLKVRQIRSRVFNLTDEIPDPF